MFERTATIYGNNNINKDKRKYSTDLIFTHMECQQETLLGSKKVALCGAGSLVEMTDNVRKVSCPKCLSIIKNTLVWKRRRFRP